MKRNALMSASKYLRQQLGNNIWSYFLFISIFIMVFVVYLWFASVGLWTSLPKSSAYYDWLATAFLHKQLYLTINPDPALLALSNPYDPSARSGINWIMDATLYNDKYYLYFGPVPAFILSFLKIFISHQIGDQYLVFAFSITVFVFEILIIKKLRGLFFQNTPEWLTYMSISMVGLANPFIIMLLSPGYHAAAITAGQFFLIGGVYFAICATETESSVFLALTGLFWAGAIGSRSTLIIAVFTGTIIVSILVLAGKFSLEKLKDVKTQFMALYAPLFIGAIVLAWYNYARFGSITNFGLIYQLTTNNLIRIQNELFSPVYIFQNLYNYFLNPYKLVNQFPILNILDGRRDSVATFIQLPKVYFTENMVGLLFSTPYILLSFLSLRKLNAHTILLIGLFLSALAPLLTFFWVAFRYTADFFPALGLLAVLGLWNGTQMLEKRPAALYIFLIISIILIIYSIAVTDLLAISNAHGRFKMYNPELLNWMKEVLYFGK